MKQKKNFASIQEPKIQKSPHPKTSGRQSTKSPTVNNGSLKFKGNSALVYTELKHFFGMSKIKPRKFPYYHVQITSGKIIDLQFTDYYFSNPNLLLAREKAIGYCQWKLYTESGYLSDCRLFNKHTDISEVIRFTTELYLVTSEDNYYQLIGLKGDDAYHELYREAVYFLEKSLVTDNECIFINEKGIDIDDLIDLNEFPCKKSIAENLYLILADEAELLTSLAYPYYDLQD